MLISEHSLDYYEPLRLPIHHQGLTQTNKMLLVDLLQINQSLALGFHYAHVFLVDHLEIYNNN